MNIFTMLNHTTKQPLWDAGGGGQGGGTGDGNPPDGGGDGKGQPDPATLFAELDDATRDWVKTRHENDPVKLAKQAYELDRFAGKAVQVPGDDATKEDLEKFWTKIGRPESTDGYAFNVPDNLPEDMPYDEKLATDFKGKAHELGLTGKQAAALHDFFVEHQTETYGEMTAKITGNVREQIDTARTELEAAWGEPSGETWKANLELAGRFFDEVDKDGKLYESLTKAGFIGPDKEILMAPLAFAFANAGAALYQEGGSIGGRGGSSVSEANPFVGKGNLTEIMRIVKADPDKAIVLARAAGVDPAKYGLK